MESLDRLPEEIVPPTVDDPFGGSESKDVALARVRSSQIPGAHAFFRAAPTDRAREIPPNEFLYTYAMYEASPGKSSWYQVAPDAIEAEMGGPLPRCMRGPVRETARR